MNRQAPFAGRHIAAFLIALMMVPVAADAQTRVKSGFNLFSAEQDVQIGQQSAVEAERQLPILNDSQVEAYVNDIGRRLAANAGGPNFPYRFRVVNASDINAFALPGGPIYLNRGIIEQAKNEGEIAGVIAHEIAHVALRHGTHQASKAYAAQAGISILGGLLGGKIGQGTANIINTVGGFGLNVLFLKYSRDLETQADIRGAQILAASGYTPADMASFFRTLEKVDKSRKTSWLSDHPAPPDRIKRIEQEARSLRVPDQPTTNIAQLNSIKTRLNSYGRAQTMEQIARSGPAPSTRSSRRRPTATTGPVSVEPPSASMRTYTSPSRVFRVAYPSNWRVHEEGTSAVTIAPEGGIGRAGDRVEVVYGAMINHYDPFGNTNRSYLRGGSSGNITLDDATSDLLAQIQRSSPHLKVIRGSGQRFSMAGGTALAASLRGNNPNTGVHERVTVVTRQLADEHLLYLLFVTPENEAARYSGLLEKMVESLQVDEHRDH
ncbi:MAG TPA: M48 family metallopeptidase [Thermoanaerobaculia bacterium]|nr:M48 family metallopeptidase [Thermoanaerobaculia bacterium]